MGTKGEICGFIGHNGAGKTTTIKAVCGIPGFDSGEITIVQKLTDNVKVTDVTPADVKNALDSDMPDYEDALLAYRSC